MDKAEARLPPSAVTRGRKRRLDVEWIQCSNTSCGKWRAIAVRGMETNVMLRQYVIVRGLIWVMFRGTHTNEDYYSILLLHQGALVFFRISTP